MTLHFAPCLRRIGFVMLLGLAMASGLPPFGPKPGHAQSGASMSGNGPVRNVRAAQAVTAMPPQTSIVGVDAKLETDERAARFVIALSAPVPVTSEVLSQPLRVIVDMPEITFQASTNAPRKGMLVTSFRAGLVSPGRSRIVFELGSPARISAVQQVSRGGTSGACCARVRTWPAALVCRWRWRWRWRWAVARAWGGRVCAEGIDALHRVSERRHVGHHGICHEPLLDLRHRLQEFRIGNTVRFPSVQTKVDGGGARKRSVNKIGAVTEPGALLEQPHEVIVDLQVHKANKGRNR